MVGRELGSIVSFDLDGEAIRFFVKDPSEEIQKYHHAGGFYEAEELEIIRHYYRKGTAFADIGSNIGNHAIFAERILKAPEVILFEPNPPAIAYLEINLALNNCRNMNRDFLGSPLSDVVGRRMVITMSPDGNLGNTVFGVDDNGPFRTITGDFALAYRPASAIPIGFVKIDTEFMEFETLAGLMRTMERFQPNIFVEAVESREAELRTWVEAHGYRIAESQKRYEVLRNYVLVPR